MKLFLTFTCTISFLFGADISFKTITSDFIQKVTSPEGSEIVYKGQFYARNDNNALWIYKSPIEKQIYFKLGRVIIVEPELEQVIITSLQNTPNLSSLLHDALHVKNNLYKANYDETTYKIHTKDKIPSKIEYLDKLENNVSIRLSNTKINTKIDDKTFKMDIPTYYDVINQ